MYLLSLFINLIDPCLNKVLISLKIFLVKIYIFKIHVFITKYTVQT